ncbi:hypothetical protein WKK05_04850 [Nostoc sp. UHCC 0302]|uniref:hypothetical protein n=1 Tax=Nostoc sp. UHCC 0302 TaxID=3134896 RepID=UPI00311CBB89
MTHTSGLSNNLGNNEEAITTSQEQEFTQTSGLTLQALGDFPPLPPPPPPPPPPLPQPSGNNAGLINSDIIKKVSTSTLKTSSKSEDSSNSSSVSQI